jgi:hypothetical protein
MNQPTNKIKPMGDFGYTFRDEGLPVGGLILQRFGRFNTAEFRALPWRRRLAFRMRRWSEYFDPGTTFHLSGELPINCTAKDVWPAMAAGMVAAAQYLVDLDQERSIDDGERCDLDVRS